MNANQRAQLESLRRVQEFLERHSPLPTAAKYPHVRDALDAIVERVADLHRDFDAHVSKSRVVTQRKAAAERRLRDEHLIPLLGLARALESLEPSVKPAPHSRVRRGMTVVEIARKMRLWAVRHRRFLVEYGLSADFLERLDEAVAAVEECARERTSTDNRRTRAGAAIAVELRNGRGHVRLLHAMLRGAFRRKSRVSAEWESAMRVRIVIIADAAAAGADAAGLAA
jgi:hypothetical protein